MTENKTHTLDLSTIRLPKKVKDKLIEWGIADFKSLQDLGSVFVFLLLKKEGLTITRSTLWQLEALLSQKNLSLIDDAYKDNLNTAIKNHPPVALFPETHEMEKIMRIALHEAKLAAKDKEVPVGAVVVKEGQIIATAHNQSIELPYIGAHAEMLALKKASRHLKNYRLDGCDLYVTLEPCAMCSGAIMQARIARVIYGVSEPKTGAAGSIVNLYTNTKLNAHTAIKSGILAKEAQELLQDFFKNKRKD